MNGIITNSMGLSVAQGNRTLFNQGGASIGLYTNVFTPSPGTLLSDLTLANYDGYAAKGSTFGPVFRDVDGLLTFLQSAQFDSTPSAGSTNLIAGVYVGNTISGLLALANLDTPRPMGALSQSLPIDLNVKNGVFAVEVLP